MDILSIWFHRLFPSPEYFLLAAAALFVLFGLIGGLTNSRASAEADLMLPDDRDESALKTWRMQNEDHYREWHAHQVREEHRTADKH